MTDRPHCSRDSQHDKRLRDAPSALARAFASVAGYEVTIFSVSRLVITERYPLEPPQVTPHCHGRHQPNRYDDGLEKCIGCGPCAWACLADVIYIEVASNEPGTQYPPGERYGYAYQINYLCCILCGMYTEACPTWALTMSTDLDELVGPGCEDLIYEKEDPLAPVPEGVVSAPHPMVEGTEDGDYYRGRVIGSTRAQIDWVRSHRPEDPSLEPARVKATPIASGRGSRHTVKGTPR